VVAGSHDGKPLRWGRAGGNDLPARARAFARALAAKPGEQLIRRRQIDHAEHWLILAHQPDIDGELIAAFGKFARAVQRIHQPKHIRSLGGNSGGDFFLRNNGNGGNGCAQAIDNQRFGGVVRIGDQCLVNLPSLSKRTLGSDFENPLSRGFCELGSKCEQFLIGHES